MVRTGLRVHFLSVGDSKGGAVVLIGHVPGPCAAAALALVAITQGDSARCQGPASLSPHQPSPSREARAPPDAAKVLPTADQHAPILHAKDWYPPVPLQGGVNTAGAEDSPFVSADGNTLWFFFTPDVRVPPEKQLLDGVTGIYVAKKAGDRWGCPERVVLEDPGQLALDGAACVGGDTLWFCSARVGNFREVDMWTAMWKGGAWRDWRNAGKRLNAELRVGEVHVMPGGRELYFHADRPGGKGKLDIWVTRQVDGQWQEPTNVEAVNSAEYDGWPFVSYDGKELWLTRWYQGTPAVFRSTRTGSTWGPPELILSQFAGEPTVDRRGDIYFVHHFYRDGKMIEADIYMARRW